MLNILCELRNVGQMPLLTSTTGSKEPTQGVIEGLVVGENEELPALPHKLEVSNRGIDGQQHPVEGAVAGHGRRQLLVKEGEQGPGPAAEMLQDSSDVGVDHEADGEVRLRMFELSSTGQCNDKGLVNGRRPSQGLAKVM